MRRLILIPAALSLVFPGCDRPEPVQVVIEKEPSVDGLVETVMDGGGTFSDVRFASLIETSTGNRVLAFDPNQPAEAEILAGIRAAMDRILEEFNRPDSITHQERRINEVSAYFEEALLEELDREPGLVCELPRTSEGNLQRSGYPDLVIRHQASGRVAYLDPKLVEETSMDSSLRTFYFTPRRETNKVLHDAHHLLIGIEHDGNNRKWKYLRWNLVDLADFRVTLKAEFQANNRDLYRPELIVIQEEAELGESESVGEGE